MSFEVDIPDGDGAVAQEAELSLDVELLQQEEAVGRHLHDPTGRHNHNPSGQVHRDATVWDQPLSLLDQNHQQLMDPDVHIRTEMKTCLSIMSLS